VTAPVPIWPPTPGYYRMRLVRHGPRVAVHIWFGQPVMDGETLDRSPRWCVAIDGRTTDDAGELFHVEQAWPYCAKEPIPAGVYHYMVAHAGWARLHDAEHPKARPRRPIDFHKLPLRF